MRDVFWRAYRDARSREARWNVSIVPKSRDIWKRPGVPSLDTRNAHCGLCVGQVRGATATVREASYINKSLSFLEQVVIALAEKGRALTLGRL